MIDEIPKEVKEAIKKEVEIQIKKIFIDILQKLLLEFQTDLYKN